MFVYAKIWRVLFCFLITPVSKFALLLIADEIASGFFFGNV